LLLGIVIVVGLSKREALLQQAVAKIQNRLKKDYQVDFNIESYRFNGLTAVAFDRVVLVPEERDTLATIRQVGVAVRLLPLLWGDVKIGKLDVTDGRVSFVKRDSTSNYDFLFRRKQRDTVLVEQPSQRNFAEWTEKIAKRVFAEIPSNLNMSNFEIAYADSTITQKVRIPEALIRGGDFEASLFLNEHEAEWMLKGELDGRRQKLRIEVFSKESGVELPFLRSKYGLKVSFDKVVFDLQHIKRTQSNLLNVDGEMEYHNLVINHRRLSDEDIVIPELLAKGGLDISTDFIALSEGSTVTAQKFSLQPRMRYTRAPQRKVELAVHTGKFKAQDFLDAIPRGLFQSLEGIQVKGEVAYDLDFAVELDHPDNIVFDSSIDDKDLKIVKWGHARIDSLNDSFVYSVYEDSTLMREIIIGPKNSNFVPLAEIPYVLKTTVRNTEDPFFYKHNGFEEEAFKLSVTTNLKEKKFKRGASTISMQLVKNIFLNRKKTMDRKLEEILLVWLMERSGQVSKDRLFEIYLNIIEWGRNVYGVSEAANYYFGKKAQELTLGESLYLSSIIPRPKTGLSSFDYTGHLKPWVQRHFLTYGSIMSKVGELNQVDVPENYGFYSVVLQPRLRPAAPAFADTLSQDSILHDHQRIMREIELEEVVRKSILDKLFGKEDKK
jgi:hypothetical protein